MKRFRTSRTALPLLAALLLLLSACGAEPSQPEGGADVQQPPQAGMRRRPWRNSAERTTRPI